MRSDRSRSFKVIDLLCTKPIHDLLLATSHYIAVYCMIEQLISNNENEADKKQIQRGQVKLVQLVYDLSLRQFNVLQRTAIVISNSISILKVDCPCRYTSVCYHDNEINNLLSIVNE